MYTRLYRYYNILFRAGTAISMHQFGWNSEEVLLKYGLIVGGMGISAFLCSFIVGPISRRYDFGTKIFTFELILGFAFVRL